jgi:hypothetical protein
MGEGGEVEEKKVAFGFGELWNKQGQRNTLSPSLNKVNLFSFGIQNNQINAQKSPMLRGVGRHKCISMNAYTV